MTLLKNLFIIVCKTVIEHTLEEAQAVRDCLLEDSITDQNNIDSEFREQIEERGISDK